MCAYVRVCSANDYILCFKHPDVYLTFPHHTIFIECCSVSVHYAIALYFMYFATILLKLCIMYIYSYLFYCFMYCVGLCRKIAQQS